jgi:hypothetical protein
MLPNRLLVIATVTASGAAAADSGVLEWVGVERSEVIVLKCGRDGERGVIDVLVRCAAERGRAWWWSGHAGDRQPARSCSSRYVARACGRLDLASVIGAHTWTGRALDGSPGVGWPSAH